MRLFSEYHWALAWLIPVLLMIVWTAICRVRIRSVRNRDKKLYISWLGEHVDGQYIESRVVRELNRSNGPVLVDQVEAADFVVRGRAAMWIARYHYSAPRRGSLAQEVVPVYDAKLSLTLEDRNGSVLWSGTFTPRSLGSRDASDDIAKQVAGRLTKVVRGADTVRSLVS
jgi:hypothetical protein